MIDVTAVDEGFRRRSCAVQCGASRGGASADRRELRVIFATGSIVGATLAPSISLATVPLSMYVVGLAAGTLPTGAISRAYGRRVAFIIGTGCGALTGLLGAFAILRGSFVLFCGATFLGGLYGAVSQSYRFAAADGASAAFRPKAVSWVMAGGVFAGVLGPQLVQWTMDIWPPYLFAFSFVVQAVVALIAMAVLAGVDAPKPAPSDLHGGRALLEIVRQPRFIAAAFLRHRLLSHDESGHDLGALAMKMCGLSVSDSNFGIQWHIVAMYGPSFFTGSLIARFGAPRIVALGLSLEAAGATIGLSGIHRDAFSGPPYRARGGVEFQLCRRVRAGTGDASAAGAQQGARPSTIFWCSDDGGGIVLVGPVAGELWLVGGQHGGVSAGAAGVRRAGGVVIREAARTRRSKFRNFRNQVSDLLYCIG